MRVSSVSVCLRRLAVAHAWPEQGGKGRGDRHRRDETDRADQRGDHLLGDCFPVDRVGEGRAADAEDEEDREGGARIGEDEGVDGRGDVVVPEPTLTALIPIRP